MYYVIFPKYQLDESKILILLNMNHSSGTHKINVIDTC